jgi:beta-lactamase class A
MKKYYSLFLQLAYGIRKKIFFLFTMLTITFLIFSCNVLNQSAPNTVFTTAPSPNINKPTPTQTLTYQQNPPVVPEWANKNNFQLPTHQIGWDNNVAISYYPNKKPLFKANNKLTEVVLKTINLIKNRKLSTDNLSITLIDASNGEISEFNKDKLMFPASVAKMFWLVALEGQINANVWKNPLSFDPFIDKMIRESDNDSSSFIIDNITGSYSSKEPQNQKNLEIWLKNRESKINKYFIASEYNSDTNLTQKTYPIPYLDLSEPKGNELQIRTNVNNSSRPIRNRLTTFDAARLMYELCYKKQAVSPEVSIKICSMLEKQVDKSKWSKIKLDDFNPIQSFFGEPLPSNKVKFYSKAGWTPKSRSEVCLVEMLDKKKVYILSIFADEPTFGQDKSIFPLISDLVYKEMKLVSSS